MQKIKLKNGTVYKTKRPRKYLVQEQYLFVYDKKTSPRPSKFSCRLSSKYNPFSLKNISFQPHNSANSTSSCWSTLHLLVSAWSKDHITKKLLNWQLRHWLSMARMSRVSLEGEWLANNLPKCWKGSTAPITKDLSNCTLRQRMILSKSIC